MADSFQFKLAGVTVSQVPDAGGKYVEAEGAGSLFLLHDKQSEAMRIS